MISCFFFAFFMSFSLSDSEARETEPITGLLCFFVCLLAEIETTGEIKQERQRSSYFKIRHTNKNAVTCL